MTGLGGIIDPLGGPPRAEAYLLRDLPHEKSAGGVTPRDDIEREYVDILLKSRDCITDADTAEVLGLLAEIQRNPHGQAALEMHRVVRRVRADKMVRGRLMPWNDHRVTEADIAILEHELTLLDPRIDRDEIDAQSLVLDALRSRLVEQAEADARRAEFKNGLPEVEAKFDEMDASIAKAVESAQKAAAAVASRIAERNKFLADVRRSMQEKGIPLSDLNRQAVPAGLVLDALQRRMSEPVAQPRDVDTRTLPQRIRDAFRPLVAAQRPPRRENTTDRPVFESDDPAVGSGLYRVTS